MATIVQGIADKFTAGGQTTFTLQFAATPTSGNLLVLFYGARDTDNNETPTFSMPSGWTKVAETSPMEFHACGIAFKTSDGTESGFQTVTPGAAVQSSWIGLVEFNQAGVSSWELDKAAANGSGATNASSIASGSTGTLASAVGVAAIAGTSRTGAEGLTTDTGTSLSATDADFEVDAGAANFIAAWLSLTATTALNATISESNGASRMGAAIAVFKEAGGASEFNGTASASLALTVSGQGFAESDGTAAASLVLTATATGLAEWDGQASASLVLSATADGHGVYAGTATASLVFTASGTGEAGAAFDPANLVGSVVGDDVTLTWDV